MTCRLLTATGAHACPTYDSVTAVGIVTLGILTVTDVLIATRQASV
ncbi:hypothetical protein ACRAWG_01160 [Methylobacterium sp. P31]